MAEELEIQMQKLEKAIAKHETESFVVTRIHRDDLVSAGFDASGVSDELMKELAKTMHECWMQDSFWYMLEDIAENMGIPKLEESEDGEEKDFCL